jgi:hypothetical protein
MGRGLSKISYIILKIVFIMVFGGVDCVQISGGSIHNFCSYFYRVPDGNAC